VRRHGRRPKESCMMFKKGGYLILLVFVYTPSDFMINMAYQFIIAFEEPTLLKVQFTTQFKEALLH